MMTNETPRPMEVMTREGQKSLREVIERNRQNTERLLALACDLRKTLSPILREHGPSPAMAIGTAVQTNQGNTSPSQLYFELAQDNDKMEEVERILRDLIRLADL